MLKIQQFGHVAKRGYHPNEFALIVTHHGGSELYPTLLTAFGCYVQGVFGMIGRQGLAIAKRTVLTTERAVEHLVAITPKDLVTAETGHPFGFGIEKIDPALQIVGNDALVQIIQNADQVFATCDCIDKWFGAHSLPVTVPDSVGINAANYNRRRIKSNGPGFHSRTDEMGFSIECQFEFAKSRQKAIF
jgi:hypothetical protein